MIFGDFCRFLYSACQLRYFSPSPSNWILYDKISYWSFVTDLLKRFWLNIPPLRSYFSFETLGKKRRGRYFVFNGGWQKKLWLQVYFISVLLTCKNNLYWLQQEVYTQARSSKRTKCVCSWDARFYRHCLWGWPNLQVKQHGILPHKMILPSCFMKIKLL